MRTFYSILLLFTCSLLAGCGSDSSESDELLYVQQSFESGWHDLEKDGADQWRWSDGDAVIALSNTMPDPKTVIVRYDHLSLAPRSLRVTLDGRELFIDSLAKERWESKRFQITLNPGMNRLFFSTSEPGVTPQGDTRELSFCVRNFRIGEARES